MAQGALPRLIAKQSNKRLGHEVCQWREHQGEQGGKL